MSCFGVGDSGIYKEGALRHDKKIVLVIGKIGLAPFVKAIVTRQKLATSMHEILNTPLAGEGVPSSQLTEFLNF